MKRIYLIVIAVCLAFGAQSQTMIQTGDQSLPIQMNGNKPAKHQVMAGPCNPPTVIDTILNTCDSGMVELNVNTNGNCANWYTAGSGGSANGNGSKFQTGMMYNDSTFYVESVCPDTAIMMNVGTQSSIYTGNNWVRGYWFTAPKNFYISGLRVPTDGATSEQSIEVVRFTKQGALPIYPATTDSFVSLGYWQKVQGQAMIPACIEINNGDRIGIYGVRGDTNSYSGGTVNSSIDGSPVQLTRSFMQDTLSVRQMHDISVTSSGSISRVEMYYSLSTDTSIRVPLMVTVPQSFNDTIPETICQGDSILFAGQYLKATGVFTDSLQTMLGCDSIPILDLTVTPCAGIGESQMEGSITVYPNPSTGTFRLIVPGESNSAANLTLVDITGRTVYQNKVPTGESTVTLSNALKNGVYMLYVESEGVKYQRKLLIE